jgi:hypothetical protein
VHRGRRNKGSRPSRGWRRGRRSRGRWWGRRGLRGSGYGSGWPRGALANLPRGIVTGKALRIGVDGPADLAGWPAVRSVPPTGAALGWARPAGGPRLRRAGVGLLPDAYGESLSRIGGHRSDHALRDRRRLSGQVAARGRSLAESLVRAVPCIPVPRSVPLGCIRPLLPWRSAAVRARSTRSPWPRLLEGSVTLAVSKRGGNADADRAERDQRADSTAKQTRRVPDRGRPSSKRAKDPSPTTSAALGAEISHAPESGQMSYRTAG